MTVTTLPPAPAQWERLLSKGSAGKRDGEALSLLDLMAPIRSQVFLHMVGALLRYSGANEANIHLDTLRSVCRELKEQIDEECLTFNYDDTCGLMGGREKEEIRMLNTWIQRHPRLRYFECLLRSKSKFRALLDDLVLPADTRCSFVFEFKVTWEEIQRLLNTFRVRRFSVIPEDEASSRGADLIELPDTKLHTLCLRRCTDAMVHSFLAVSPRLQSLQVMDSRLLGDPGFQAGNLRSLSLIGVVSMPDEHFSTLIAGCPNLRSLYIAKCPVSNITVALPHLELLSVTQCRQLSDQCATELLNPANNPSLRFLDLTEDRGLVSPTMAHPTLEIAWLMHCPQLTEQAISHMFQNCPSLAAANLVQSSIESAFICSHTLRALELTTAQKLTDTVVSHLLQHCPNLTFLDIGHCCQLLEPKFVHPILETILLSFCVNLRESAISGLFANCPSLRYVELAVCMFDMTRFQRECNPKCQVVVNFDF